MANSNTLSELSIPHQWPVEVVTSWLIEIQFGKYVPLFEKQRINGAILLSDEFVTGALKSLIPDLKDRYRFILALDQLKSRMDIVSTGIDLNERTVIQGGESRSSTPTWMCETTTTLSSRNYTMIVKEGETLESIARQKKISLEELSGANPNVGTQQRLKNNEKIYLPEMQHLIEKGIKDKSSNGCQSIPDTIDGQTLNKIPDTIDDQTLNNYKKALKHYFQRIDTKRNAFIDIVGLRQFFDLLNLNELTDSQVVDIYLDMEKREDGQLTFEHLFEYFQSIVVMENELSDGKICLFSSMLTADHLNRCSLGGITQFLNKTWAKFSHYRRYGVDGQLVMSSGDNISVVEQGTHNLLDLICWPDNLTDTIVPIHVVVKGFEWHSKSKFGPEAKAGELIFPNSFSGELPTEIATPQTLKYYGCCFANETQQKVSLLHRHETEDFEYHEGYREKFVESNGPGLERHEFAHLDCPHSHHTRNGWFILGKITNDDELHLTAFQIPIRHALYIPPNTIHSNDYLKGKWRTMLAEADIDRVVLKRRRLAGGLQTFAFDFPPQSAAFQH